MRIGYVASDRLDLLELTQACNILLVHHWSLLKRIGRDLSGHGRLVQKFNNQDKITKLTVWSDSIRSRKSTSSTCDRFGQLVH